MERDEEFCTELMNLLLRERERENLPLMGNTKQEKTTDHLA